MRPIVSLQKHFRIHNRSRPQN